MTLEEQIMKLQTYKMFEGEDTVYVERDDVLKLLEQEPCEDAISREDALMALTGEWTELTDEMIHHFIKRIKKLPPVTPQPKTDTLDKIRAEIMQVADQEKLHDGKWALGLRYAVKIIDKYKAESEDKE